jgi:hypothetical protein
MVSRKTRAFAMGLPRSSKPRPSTVTCVIRKRTKNKKKKKNILTVRSCKNIRMDWNSRAPLMGWLRIDYNLIYLKLFVKVTWISTGTCLLSILFIDTQVARRGRQYQEQPIKNIKILLTLSNQLIWRLILLNLSSQWPWWSYTVP